MFEKIHSFYLFLVIPFSFFDNFIINCTIFPDTTITITVDTIVITVYGIHAVFIICQESIKPTAAGINIIGIISMKKRLLSFIADIEIIFNSKHRNKIIIP